MSQSLGTLFFIVFAVVIFLGICGFWLWSLIDCATKEPDNGNNKLVWILIIIFAGPIGSVIYCIVRRPRRWAAVGR